MKYYLGEIWFEKKGNWLRPSWCHKFTTKLVTGNNWQEAKKKFDVWAAEYVGKSNVKMPYKTFITEAI